MTNPSFKHFDWKNGLLYDDSHNPDYPTRLHALIGEQTFHFKPDSSYFLFLYSGVAYVKSAFPLLPGYYSVCNSDQEYVTGNEHCRLIIIESIIQTPCTYEKKWTAPFLLGGPLEDTGRLKYIDGCTDSLLIAPWRYGEPCLNHLHFPKGIDQTPHTHPSIRIGMVVRGHGECVTPFGNVPLSEGMIFAILPHKYITTRRIDPTKGHTRDNCECVYEVETGIHGNPHPVGTHSFRTTDSTMDVIAFHPDSDYGPTDEEHPMINRTMVFGISAKHIDEIRTK